MRTVSRSASILFITSLAGCTMGGGTIYQAGQFTQSAPLGRTAVLLRRPTSDEKPFVSDDLIRARVFTVLTKQAGATEATLPESSASAQSRSDYELVVAARAAGIDTLCVVTIENMYSQFSVSLQILPPPVQASSHAVYNIRLLDVATGKLRLESMQHDYTMFPPIEKNHSLVDLERGLTRTLRLEGVGIGRQPATLPSAADAH